VFDLGSLVQLIESLALVFGDGGTCSRVSTAARGRVVSKFIFRVITDRTVGNFTTQKMTLNHLTPFVERKG
jgi:acyl CoA:acetate/3-ketoacid CoA transferase beta subunit